MLIFTLHVLCSSTGRIEEQKRLIAAVKVNAIEKHTKALLNQKENIYLKRRQESDEAIIVEYNRKLKEIDIKMNSIIARCNELIKDKYMEYDWMKISAGTVSSTTVAKRIYMR